MTQRYIPNSVRPINTDRQAEVFEMLVEDDCIQEFDRPIELSSGQLSRVKINAERLSSRNVERLVGFVAETQAFIDADAVAGMPDGMTGFALRLHELTGKPLIELEKNPYARTGLIYAADQRNNHLTAVQSSEILAVDDVTTSGGTFYAARRLLHSESSVSTMSLLLRGSILPENDSGFSSHSALARVAVMPEMNATDVRKILSQ